MRDTYIGSNVEMGKRKQDNGLTTENCLISMLYLLIPKQCSLGWRLDLLKPDDILTFKSCLELENLLGSQQAAQTRPKD